MNFNSWDLGSRKGGDIVEVQISGNAANVILVDSSNFTAFKAGRNHRYYGGLAKRSPVRLRIPHSGHWYVVLHFGGLAGRARASVQVLPGALPELRQTTSSSPLGGIRQAADEYSAQALGGEDLDDRAYDVFICHSSEDKDEFVRPLAEALRRRNVAVWFDEFELNLGDSLRRKIDSGLVRSRFGVVVLSKSFFAKNWPQYELDGLVTREMAAGKQIILPVWHEVTQAEVMGYSPSLADKVAVSTDKLSVDAIADQIAEVAARQSDEAA
jgi:hypothetical protein